MGRQAIEHAFFKLYPQQAYFSYFISKRFGYKLDLKIFMYMPPKLAKMTCEAAIERILYVSLLTWLPNF